MQTIADHFHSITICGSSSCWQLPHRPQSTGHIQLRLGGKLRLAHRAVYECLIGPIPRGLILDHLCRRRWCCNPNHVQPVTVRVNNLRGNGASGVNARKVHCKRGHLLRGKNLRPGYGNWRVCNECHRLAARKHRRDKLARIDIRNI